MFDRIHEMRARIIKSPAFNGDRILGAILFEQTMDRQIDGLDTGDFLWSKKNVVPFLKIDKGLEAEADGVQLMKPMPGLDDLLDRGVAKNIFGTKERSVIKLANPDGVCGHRRPAVRGRRPGAAPRPGPHPRAGDRHPLPGEGPGRGAPQGGAARRARAVPDGQQVMFKLTLPETDGFYHRTGGAPQGPARGRPLRRLQPRRGQRPPEPEPRCGGQLLPGPDRGLTAQQSDDDFDAALDAAVSSIFAASKT